MLLWFSDLIHHIYSVGFSQIIYNIFFAGGFVGLTIYNLSVAKRYGLTKLKAMLLTVMVYAASAGWMFVLYWVFTGKWGGNNIVRIFVWVPVFTLPAAKLIKKRLVDLLRLHISVSLHKPRYRAFGMYIRRLLSQLLLGKRRIQSGGRI